jgi:membrane-associated phospholipid phosphatase
MEKIKKFIKKNKKFLISISILLIGQAFLYWFLKLFQKDPIYISYYLDDKIPFLGRFVYIYNSFYPFVFLSLFLLYKNDDKAYYKGIISGVIGYLICDVIFICFPTIMYRPVIPSINPFTDFIIKITFYYDNPPLNCFPSIHCLFCFQVIYSFIFSKSNTRQKILITIYSLLVIVSTLFIKQHYIYDVISAFAVMLITNTLTDLLKLYDRFKKKKII